MKRFLKYVAVSLILLLLTDAGFGLGMDYLNSKTKGGGAGKRNYIALESNEEILMFGSSKMSHHYNSKIIQDSLGMTCYNCGEDGNGIIFSYGMLQLVLERYTPKMIIYDVSPFDVAADDYTKYTNLLKPYVSAHSDLKDFVVSILPNEKWKMFSSFYRYNSNFISILGGLTYMPSYQGGYEPLKGVMTFVPKPVGEEFFKNYESIDATKEHCLRQFIETCLSKDIKLIFAESPYFQGASMAPSYPLVQKLCKEYGITYIDCVDLPGIVGHKEYFRDLEHMNEEASNMYTRYFVTQIKRL
jgi:hypothetical protein